MTAPVDVSRWRGAAAGFHARIVGEPEHPQVWVFDVERPALVLGSSQPASSVDAAAAAAAGVEVTRRRSGGGAVWLEPDEMLWLDAVVPAPRLRDEGVGDDVAGAMRWFGARLSAAARHIGIANEMHRGPMIATEWSPVWCFDGLGPGELVDGDAKLMGVSARRTRTATRFQCALPIVWHPERALRYLVPSPSAGDLRPVRETPSTAARRLPDALAVALG
ncbi:MAG: lipoyl protein ligase domain-containing protein [Desertimonas sp.]